MVDGKDQKLLVVTNDTTGANLLHLHRCDLQGDNCALTDANAGQPNGSGAFTVTRNTVNPANEQASLFRRDPKDAKCTHANVSPAGRAPSRRSLRSLSCTHWFLAPGTNFGDDQSIAVERTSERVFVAATDGASETHVFTFQAW